MNDPHFSFIDSGNKNKNCQFLQKPSGDLCCVRVVQADQSPWQKLVSVVVIGLYGGVTLLSQLKQKYT